MGQRRNYEENLKISEDKLQWKPSLPKFMGYGESLERNLYV